MRKRVKLQCLMEESVEDLLKHQEKCQLKESLYFRAPVTLNVVYPYSTDLLGLPRKRQLILGSWFAKRIFFWLADINSLAIPDDQPK